MNYLLPQGIGDSIWALVKIEGFAKHFNDPNIHIKVACFYDSPEEKRAVDFISRFSFITSVAPYLVPYVGQQGPVLQPGNIADENGHYRYLPDGIPRLFPLPGIDYVLIPNAPLERGQYLENWFPQIPSRWDIMDDFRFTESEINTGKTIHEENGNFVTFFMGNISNNTSSGHNRNGIWSPQDWYNLGNFLIDTYDVNIVVVGSDSDREYFDRMVVPMIPTKQKQRWTNCVGGKTIGETFSITKRSKAVISYQSGIGIVSSYIGVPVAIFWRAKGDSILADRYLSLDEDMAKAWVPPQMRETKHLPLIYGRHGVTYILDKIEKLGWMKG
jgi:hypothetical protein